MEARWSAVWWERQLRLPQEMSNNDRLPISTTAGNREGGDGLLGTKKGKREEEEQGRGFRRGGEADAELQRLSPRKHRDVGRPKRAHRHPAHHQYYARIAALGRLEELPVYQFASNQQPLQLGAIILFLLSPQAWKTREISINAFPHRASRLAFQQVNASRGWILEARRPLHS
ncbi:hypothetical protein AOQ84DRAFT_371637 [Glonium stellatum]|uniref:Uncharacterized protein n=1 Tax=Glonium stellatum TaxID=574774 RepID=A0A8E2FBC4_9PEZI|nr:hypothetical protein AOQ84DRAFT_371637 [Glonium stellatum]